ncbi:MAG: hypothetical protein ACK5BL_11445 [Flavobacteriales bacterium]|jgi:hypothetical protein
MTILICAHSILIGTFTTRYIMHLAWASNYKCNATEEAGLIFSLIMAWGGAWMFGVTAIDLLLGVPLFPDFTDFVPFTSAYLSNISMKYFLLFVALYTIIFKIISYYKQPYFIHRFAVELILFFVLYIIQLTIALVLLKSADMLLDYLLT